MVRSAKASKCNSCSRNDGNADSYDGENAQKDDRRFYARRRLGETDSASRERTQCDLVRAFGARSLLRTKRLLLQAVGAACFEFVTLNNEGRLDLVGANQATDNNQLHRNNAVE